MSKKPIFAFKNLAAPEDEPETTETTDEQTQEPAVQQDVWAEVWELLRREVEATRDINQSGPKSRPITLAVSQDLKAYLDSNFMAADFKLGNPELLQMGMAIAKILKERGYLKTFRKRLVLDEEGGAAE